MKKYFIYAASALALAACSSDEYLGELPSQPQSESTAIMFGSNIGKMTRADKVGAEAAALLGKKFTVEGSKTVSDEQKEVFDDYLVKWAENTAGTTESNTSDWEYVGTAAVAPSSIAGNTQTIKYWDYSASQYDFAAYSTGTATAVTTTPTSGQVQVSAIDYANLGTTAYTLKGAADDLAKCYISDLVTAYNPMVTNQPAFQQEVKFNFRSLGSKVRVALYETIPGYSVKGVKFYADDATTALGGATATTATLFTNGSAATDKFYADGTMTVMFKTTGKSNVSNTDYNKAHVTFASTGTAATTKEFGALNYGAKADKEKTAGNIWLGRTSATATFAGSAAPYWTSVLPNETGTVLELRVDYTLESIDGSGEEINVYGAKAFVPAIFAAWQPNYAYTYIFKISDNTNGWTSKTAATTDPAGLYPITFDAVVADVVDGAEQTTITTVATPSITTYQKGHLYTVDNEYSAAKGDIYVQVMNAGTLIADLDQNGQLYSLSKVATEAEVLDALNMTTTAATGYDVTGRNGLSLKKETSNATITAIPGVNGNDITVTTKTAAKFTPSTGTYAYVYTVTAPSGTGTPVTTAVTPANATDVSSGYYTDEACTTPATGTADGTTVYYQKYIKNDGVYAVKVIKVID